MKKEVNEERGDSRTLSITVNGKKYHWSDQYITGADIRKLGAIAASDLIFLSVKKPWQDELIEDNTKVNLARPEVEHFYSERRVHEFTIIVNGSMKKWLKDQISFVEIVTLAFGQCLDKPTVVYTVAYEDGPKQNPEGSMLKGQYVFVKNKMIFHATATDKS